MHESVNRDQIFALWKQAELDVFEFYEAFAGQLLATLDALDSDRFAVERLGGGEKAGRVPMERLNTWGGSLALGTVIVPPELLQSLAIY